MNISIRRWLGIGLLAALLPLGAAAQQAFARGSLNLRAGPSTEYPVVAMLAPGQPLDVLGCNAGYGWCDVVLPDGLRGWVAASLLDYPYEDQRVPLATYGAAIGVPIIAFAIGNYWADHYRDRPWYGDRRWWHGRPPPPAAGWRPGPPPRPGWNPRPPRPGFNPPGQGFRPPGQGGRPPPGIRPPREPGIRPPQGGGFRPPGTERPRPQRPDQGGPSGGGRPPGQGFGPRPGGDRPGRPGAGRPQRPGGGEGGGGAPAPAPGPRPGGPRFQMQQ